MSARSDRSEPTLRDKIRKFMLEPYLDWAEGEGVPIYEDFAIDMLSIETKPWARFGLHGAICHLKGRDDFLTTFLNEIPPGGSGAPTHHIYEEVIYVLSGHGSTSVEINGKAHNFEWGPRSLFSVPLNATYRHFNASGREPARLAATNNLTYLMNLFSATTASSLKTSRSFPSGTNASAFSLEMASTSRSSKAAINGRPILSPISPISN